MNNFFSSNHCKFIKITAAGINNRMSLEEPLYENSRASTAAAWHSVMHFSLANHLPYAAITHLLQLLQFLLPAGSQIPSSFYRLKQQYCSGTSPKKQFCSVCLQEVPLGTRKCPSITCQQSGAELCWYVKASFQDHLKEIYQCIVCFVHVCVGTCTCTFVFGCACTCMCLII